MGANSGSEEGERLTSLAGGPWSWWPAGLGCGCVAPHQGSLLPGSRGSHGFSVEIFVSGIPRVEQGVSGGCTELLCAPVQGGGRERSVPGINKKKFQEK